MSRPIVNLAPTARKQRVQYKDVIPSNVRVDQEYRDSVWGRGPVFTAAPNLYAQGKQPVIRNNLKDPRYAQQWAETKGYTAYSQNDWDGDRINDVVVVGKDGIHAFNGYTTTDSQWNIDQGYYSAPREERKKVSRKSYKNYIEKRDDSARDVFLREFVKPVWTAYYEANPGEMKLNYIEFSAMMYKYLVLYIISKRLAAPVAKGSIKEKIQTKIKNNKSVKDALSRTVVSLYNIDQKNNNVIRTWIWNAIISRYHGAPPPFNTIKDLLDRELAPPLVTNEEYDAFAARFTGGVVDFTEDDELEYEGIPASPQKHETTDEDVPIASLRNYDRNIMDSPARNYGQSLRASP